jgi:hypothetical protein
MQDLTPAVWNIVEARAACSGSLSNFLLERLSFDAVARRIEIELTSKLDGGGFTWRAAGAREPRGVLDASIVPSGASVGDVLRAEVDIGIDGIDVLSITSRKSASPLDLRGEQLPLLRPAESEATVSVIYAEKGRARRSDRDTNRGRDERSPRPGRRPSRAATGASAPRTPRSPRDERPRDERPRDERPRDERPRGDRERVAAGASAPRTPRSPRDERPRDDRARGERSRDGEDRGRPARRGAPSGRTPQGPRRDARSNQELRVSTTHRNALLATLRPEQLAVAEQLLRGGMPAVRQAIDEQNRAALAQGRPTIAPETILAIAENLLPITSLAAWKDRAAAVQGAGPQVRLRDLRPIVTAARNTSLDEEARGVLKELQALLHSKTEELRTQWVAKLESLLERNEVIEALHVAARPPDQSTRCSAALAASLTEAAGRALDPELTATAWIAVLDAVVASPIKRSVHPAGIPAAEEARAAAVKAAGHVPALAKLLGMRIPPPPPTPQRRPALSGRRSS